MSVTEIKQAIGGWTLRLREDTPQQIRDALTFYGHIAILPGELPVVQYGDALLASARYVGVLRGYDAEDGRTLKGSGMAFWLGDEDEKGDVFETAVTLTATTFANSIRALLPPGGAITEGTLYSVAGTYNGKHQWENPRSAITYVADTFGAEWRVNNAGTLDAGTVSQLYVTTPKAILMRKGFGADLSRRALPGRMAMGVDVEDTTTRVVLLAEGEGTNISTATANAPATPYKDIHGNPIKVTRLISESGTETGNAAARAQLMLNRFLNARRAVSLSTNEFDVKGSFVVGDYLDVYDPENGFFDANREVYWNGERINPMALRCVEMTWPIPEGWTVGFRDINGTWVDLTPYYEPEGGDTTIVVGELARGLASVGGEAVGVRPNLPDGAIPPADATIPAAPTFTDFSAGSYQASDSEWTRAAIYASWAQPLNTDGSVITDGGHYEIRYRVNTWIGYRVKWGQLKTAGYKWGELSTNKWGAPITEPVQASQEWNTVYVAWGQTQTLIQELTPGIEYEFQIRAVDAANPPHLGPWSASTFVIATGDIFAPDVPAAPVVASSRIAIQVMHLLGKASGGTFNLQPDLVYLSVHVGGSDSFFPDDTNEVGKLIANAGMLQANIPAIGTFQIEQTDNVWVKVVAVDRAGNRSGPSAAAQATAELIDDAHISDLTVSKVTAGSIMATWLMAGAIKTAETGARVELDAAGLKAFNGSGSKTVDISSADGSVSIVGQLKTDIDGKGITINPGSNPNMILRPNATDNNEARLFSFFFEDSVATQLGIEDGPSDMADGGKVLIFKTGAILSHQPDFSGGLERYIGLNWPQAGAITITNPGSQDLILNNDTGTIRMLGKFENYIFADPKQAIFTVGDTTAGTGPVTPTYTYGPTMARTLYPVVSAKASADTFVRVSANSTTSFTVGLSAAVPHGLYAWCVAM